MATAELKVRIEAEIAEFKKGLDKANKDLTGFSGKVTTDLKRTATEAAKASAILGGSVAKGSNQAAFALNNLGRVAQDAPFGFMGIQNNLNPLLESFQQLKTQTGTTSGAIKVLGASLIGPAGLGLALSLVSSGILIYQEYIRKSNKETKQAIDANKELADSILTISGVQAEGRANASKDLSQLQSLYNATQNLNIPSGERLKIAKDLIKRYPEYLKGLTAEEILAGKAAAQYTKLTNAILAKGYAQAAEENRQKLINQQLNAKVELTKEQAALELSAAELLKRTTQKQATLDIQGQAALENGINRVSSAVEESKKKINELNKVYADAGTEIKILDDVTQGLIKTYGAGIIIDPKASNANIRTQSDVLKDLDINIKAIGSQILTTFGKASEEKISAINKAIKDLISIKAPQSIIARLQQDLLALDQSGFQRAGKTGGLAISTGISEGFNTAIPVVATDLSTKLKTGLSDWQTYVNNDLLPKVQTNFETFFNDILMHGKLSFDSLGKAILNTFLSIAASDAARSITNLLRVNTGAEYSATKGKGGLLGGLVGLLGIGGKSAAAGGGTAAAAGTATAASGGLLLPILGGIAAVAGIASLFKKRKTEPAPAFTTSNAISTSSSSNVDFGSGRVVFEISGVNLVGVLNRAGAKLQRFGP